MLVVGWVDDGNFNDVYFVLVDCGWVVGDWGLIFRMEDGGNCWEWVDLFVVCIFNVVYFVDEFNGWVVGGFVKLVIY